MGKLAKLFIGLVSIAIVRGVMASGARKQAIAEANRLIDLALFEPDQEAVLDFGRAISLCVEAQDWHLASQAAWHAGQCNMALGKFFDARELFADGRAWLENPGWGHADPTLADRLQKSYEEATNRINLARKAAVEEALQLIELAHRAPAPEAILDFGRALRLCMEVRQWHLASQAARYAGQCSMAMGNYLDACELFANGRAWREDPGWEHDDPELAERLQQSYAEAWDKYTQGKTA